MSESRQLSPIDQFKKQLASEHFTKQLKSVLAGSPISIAKFQRTAVMAVSNNPSLLNGDANKVVGELLKCAADGLLPDSRDAVILMMKGQPAYLPMVRGLYKKIRMDSRIDNIYAEVVFDKDHFRYKKGTEPFIDHEPCLTADRGKPIGAYCIVHWKDSSVPSIEWMPESELQKAREASAASNSPAYRNWPDEMRKKSVVHRMEKSIGTSPEVSDFFSRDMKLMLAHDSIVEHSQESLEQRPHQHGHPSKNLSDIIQRAKAGKEEPPPALEDNSQPTPNDVALEKLNHPPYEKEAVKQEAVSRETENVSQEQKPSPQSLFDGKPPLCGTCGDKGIYEDADGKGPCPDCRPASNGPTNPNHKG